MTSLFSNGRNAAIFCLHIGLVGHAYALKIGVESDVVTNKGVLTNDYWKNQQPKTNPSRVVGYSDVRLFSEWEINDRPFFLEKRKLQTFVGNTNSLSMAAQEKVSTQILPPGKYGIDAKLNSYEWNGVGARFISKGLAGFNWQLSPKVVQLKNFKKGAGIGELEVSASDGNLTGTLERESSRAYGPLLHEQPVSSTLGFLLDASFATFWSGVNLEGEISNAYSYLRVDQAHFSERSYQVVESSGEIQFSKTPSLTGRYGQRDRLYRIPQIAKLSISKDNNESYRGGVLSMDGYAMPWLGVRLAKGGQVIEVDTYAFENLTLKYQIKNFVIRKLTLGVSVSSGLHAKPQVRLQLLTVDL